MCAKVGVLWASVHEVRQYLSAVCRAAGELSQLDLGTPVGAVPNIGKVSPTPLLIDVALVVRFSILHTRTEVQVSALFWAEA